MGSPDEKDKPSTILPGTVERIIKPIDPQEPGKAQIEIEKGEDLYREIRVDNVLKDEKGEEVSIKEGAPVEVIIKAERKDTTKREKAVSGALALETGAAMLLRLFECRNCGSLNGYASRPRTFAERYILPLLFLRPVRCGDCFSRFYRTRLVLVQEHRRSHIGTGHRLTGPGHARSREE